LEVKVPFERKNSTALAHELVIDTVPSDSRTRKTRSESRFVLRRVGAEALVLGKLMNIEVFGIELGMLDARVEESWVGEERVPVGFVVLSAPSGKVDMLPGKVKVLELCPAVEVGSVESADPEIEDEEIWLADTAPEEIATTLD
jgi:hypothetical protein